MKYYWRPSWDEEHIEITCQARGLLGGTKVLQRCDWPNSADLPGRSLLSFLVDREKAAWTDTGAVLSHATIAELTETQAQLIGLPSAPPFALQIKSHGTLDQASFTLTTSWRKLGHTPVQTRRIGAILEHGSSPYRLPASLYRLLEVIDEFSNEDATPEARVGRVTRWIPVQESLKEATGANINQDGYIGELQIFHAASLSLTVSFDKDTGVTFDPVLFGRTVTRRTQVDLFPDDPNADPAMFDEDELDEGLGGTEGVDTLVDEADQLLPPELHNAFLRKRFDRDIECRPSYPLGDNAYVVFDPSLRRALDLVKTMQKGSQQERRAFVKNPRAAFSEALEDVDDESTLAHLFIETQQYADRVNDIGLWHPKVLPWMPQTPNSWLPEKIGFTFGGHTVELRPEELDEVKRACEEAISRKEPTFVCGEGVEVPATADTLAAVEALRAKAADLMAANPTDSSPTPVEKDGDEADSDRYALTIDDNLESVNYHSTAATRQPAISLQPPAELITSKALFPHQMEGFDWLVKSWTVGRPGVLLADDMGLGKTVQTLAFAAWLDRHFAESSSSPRGPFLIVAPTALLRNWRAEHDKHLAGEGIGPILELYGSAVSSYRQAGATGRDVSEGRSVLDRDRLMSASIILTTYETLANYHISFAGLRFPLVIFDEIQKLKTPTTINTHAAKTVNADFVIGLTGTPVENNLTELWSIMDRLHPGYLGDLKSFSSNYPSNDTAKLRELRDTLMSTEQFGTAVMLRRMKDATDLGRALPEKMIKPIPKEMPEIQANAYAQIIAEARRAKADGLNKGMMLQVLQKMRGVSLHPEHPSTVLGRPDTYPGYIAKSARLQATIEALDLVAEKLEKALVFIEFRDMQELLADIVRHRYHLGALPGIINGQTPSAKRQSLVDEFQATPQGQFNLMILAPRAAGVGLTITAANHVIHLSRWWNPAVEDQCNDRAYRIGQDKPVTVYCPIARHPLVGDSSFDVTLNSLLERKRSLSRDLLVPMEGDRDYQELYENVVG
jgi:SNF2 domain-containing protein/helicase-like protein